ncbi:MAG: DNA-3-methyladenine glycosylase [Phycisphaerales bacterium]|nr:DNA-3-methyladenine glycosylase [Phycisphaerales bacterium]
MRRDFRGRADVVAASLLGDVLCVASGATVLRGRIVETEAYLGPQDHCCHTHHGRTPRNASMWLGAGYLYVYRIYGMHWCANIVSGRTDEGAAVLLRAVEPLDGVSRMRRRRRCGDRDLCRGPGRLCHAMGISGAHDGLDLRGGDVWIERGAAPRRVARSARIGMGTMAHTRWGRACLRFCDADSALLSRPA